MRIQLICVLCCALAIINLPGCSMHDAAVEAKVQFATKHVQLAYLNGRSPIFSRWGTNILMVLSPLGLAQKQKPGKKAEFQHNDLGFSRPVFV